MKTFLLILLSIPLFSQPARYHFGDDPRWAELKFDDSAWLEAENGNAPAPPLESGGVTWLRCRVAVPANDTGPLAVGSNLVTMTANPHEIWVNGFRAGGEGSFPPRAVSWIAPETGVYDLPAGIAPPGSTAIVALRIWTSPSARFPGFRANFPVRFEIGAQELLRNKERLAIAESRLAAIPTLITGAGYLLLGAGLFLIWHLGRGSRELLWFAALLCSFGLTTGVPAAEDLLRFRMEASHFWGISILLGIIRVFVFPEFEWAVFGIRNRIPLRVIQAIPVASFLLLFFVQTTTEPEPWLGPATLAFFVQIRFFGLVNVGIAAWQFCFKPETRAVAGAMFVWSALQSFRSPQQLGSILSVATILLCVSMTALLIRRTWKAWRQKEELEADLQAARQVQTALLSSGGTASKDFAVETVYEPAKQVGGDFYWFSDCPEDGSLLVVVGDVSGKGLQAAMMVSVAVGILGVEESKSPATILSRLNNGLVGRTTGFVTCCCARFDRDGTATIANAGHPSPYCDSREVILDAGLPLGVVQGIAYDEQVVAGSRFTFVSDGVVEAASPEGELFGFERTRAISGKCAQEIAAAARAWGQNDDITVVTVRRVG